MALLLCTGFETIPPGSGNAYVRNLEAQGWTFYNTWVQSQFPGGLVPGIATGRYPNGQAVQIGFDSGSTASINAGITRSIGKTFTNLLTNGGVSYGFAVRYGTTGTNAGDASDSIGLCSQTGSNVITTVTFGVDRTLAFYRNASGVATGVNLPASPTITDGGWHYVDVIVGPVGTNSFTVTVVVDGEIVGVTGTLTTQAAVLNETPRFAFPKYGSTTGNSTTIAKATAFDDIYVMDRTGTVNNGLALGEIREYRRGPTTDVQAQWTRVGGAASNAATVNKRDFTSTTEYIYPATSVVEDIYSSTDIISGLSVVAVNIEGFGFQDSGSQAITPVLKLTSEYEGSNVVMNATPTYFKTTFEQNPETSAAWTLSQANASQFGVKG